MSDVLELLLADARTPSGGYAHSGGLEPFLAGGGSASEVPGFMRARLQTVGGVEACFAAMACAAGSVPELLALDLELAARTPSEPLRRAARRLGRGLLRTASVWFAGNASLAAYEAASELTPRPIVLGAVARIGGITPAAAARASLYDDAATVAAAAVKLLPLDAAVSSRWVLELADEIERLAGDAADAAAGSSGSEGSSGSAGAPGSTGSPGSRVPSRATTLLDLRALTHAHNDRRLFAS